MHISDAEYKSMIKRVVMVKSTLLEAIEDRDWEAVKDATLQVRSLARMLRDHIKGLERYEVDI